MKRSTYHSPPRLASKLFRLYCRPDRVEELEGDLDEFYSRRLSDGTSKWRADLFYWWNVIRCYRSYARKKTQNNYIMGSLMKSYFKLALRHSWNNRLAVGINVIGLGVSLGLCVFVYMLYAYNLEFDTFFEDTEDVYRVHSIGESNGMQRRSEITPLAIDDKLRTEISGIEALSSYYAYTTTVKQEGAFSEHYIGFASSDFFEIFEMPLKYGSLSSFEDQPTIYIKDYVAKKYFGSGNPLGQSLTLYFGTEKLEVTVGGVFEKIPLNSSFGFDILMAYNHYVRIKDIDKNDWSNHRYVGHFLKLNPNAIEQVESTLNGYLSQYNDEDRQLRIDEFELVPFRTELHADHIVYRKYTNGRFRPQVFIIFFVLISLVFLTACFNLTNTTVGLMAKRLKEIGVRKTLGSGSRQILVQFLFEMFVVTSLAFVVAVSSANYIATAIMGLFGATFILQDLNFLGLATFIGLFLLFTTVVAGLLPALYAWKFQPAAIIRKNVRLKGINWLNKSLTVAQFGFSITVLIIGITFSQNSQFLRNVDLGYNIDDIIYIPIGKENMDKIRAKVDQIHGVSTAATGNHFGSFGRYSGQALLQVDTSFHDIQHYGVSQDYLEMMGIELAQGKFFEGKNSEAVLVTQSFVKTYLKGEDPINKVLKLDSGRKVVIGVVRDIIDDVYEDSEDFPTVISLTKEDDYRHLVVKAFDGDPNRVNDEIKKIWSDHIDEPYPGELQSDFALGSAGRDTKNLQKIFISMAFLSGFLSLVGIFSLSKINIARRVKEISIRKVLGASIRELLLTVNRPFLYILSIALVMGCGLGYFISDVVLSMIYKYHVDASLLVSLGCGLMVLLISVLLISVSAVTPVSANPVQGIRDE